MKYPIKNRITAQATLPNFELFSEESKLSENEIEGMIKDKLVIGFANEFINKVSMEKIGGVGNEFETKYVLEAYVFTRDQLDTFMEEIKDAFIQEAKNIINEQYY